MSEVMSRILSSQKSFVAFYTSDSSLSLGPLIQVFQLKREADGDGDFADEASSNTSSTTCAAVSVNTTRDSRRCAMMCLTTPIYIANVFNSGRVKNVIDAAYEVKFING